MDELLLVRWTGFANELMRACLNFCMPVLKDPQEVEPQSGFVLNLLGLSCHTTSESALLLTRYGRVWDSEILVRSVLEGTLKYAFMCHPDQQTRAARVEEYWTIMPEHDRLKQHERIAQFRDLIGKTSPASAAFGELLLTDEEARALCTAHPRKTRQALAQKWSFSEILRALATEIPGKEELAMLALTYGLSSHTAHQDADGTGMIWERLQRGHERRELVELAHAARQANDLFMYSIFRALMTYRLTERDKQPIKDFWDKQTPFLQELHDMEQRWWDIEREYCPPTP